MTEQQALDLIQRIEQEEGGRVQATLTHTMNRGIRKSAVHLLLKPGQRTVRIVQPGEWESLQVAWREIWLETPT